MKQLHTTATTMEQSDFLVSSISFHLSFIILLNDFYFDIQEYLRIYIFFFYHQFNTGNKLIIRPDEALIVILVLILWIVAIGLFVHRWGKIRNCEPYTPKFHDAESSHRSSCHDQANLINKRLSMTKSSTVLQPIQPSCGSINIQQQQQQHFVPSSSLQQPSYNGKRIKF
jgi:hypothetical protein